MQFDDKELIFEVEGEMLNATRMSLTYGQEKSPEKWLDTNEAKGLQKLIAAIEDCKPEEIVCTRGEGENVTVWMNMGLGLPYAGWLLPAFKEWCAKKVKEIKKETTKKRAAVKSSLEDMEDSTVVVMQVQHPDSKPS